jgi:hypothetical protein
VFGKGKGEKSEGKKKKGRREAIDDKADNLERETRDTRQGGRREKNHAR